MSAHHKRCVAIAALWATAIAGSSLYAQNPVPLINNLPMPDAAAPGSPGLKLTVNGTGFVSGATVNWNGSPRATVFVSISQLTATILASDLNTAATVSITATNPAPGGGTSNVVFFQVTSPTPTAAFANSSTYPLSDSTNILSADLNGDGNLDLVASNGSNGIAVLLGNGNGTFQSPQTFPTGGVFPESIALGDFNNDGKVDVVTANFSSGVASLSILFGNGDGTFQPFQSFPLDTTPSWITVGDFNGDGKLDVAVPICPLGILPQCGAASAVSILLGNGDGTFQPGVDYPAGLSVTTSVAGDFNGDGHLDLAVSGSDGSSTNGIGILLGNGDGSFQSPSFLSGPYYFLTTADLNQDGILDLAAIGNDTAGFRLQEVAGLRTGDADRIEAYLTCAGVGNGDDPRRADGSQRHASEIHRRRNQLYEGTLARQQHLLRAGRCVVRDAYRGILLSVGVRQERDRDLAGAGRCNGSALTVAGAEREIGGIRPG
jgi:hypothetical protein